MCAKQSATVLRPAGPKVCPICNKPSYSAGGVHPQCSQHKADMATSERLKAAKKAEPPTAKSTPAVKSWQKRCPECHVQVHVRLARCACGFTFSG